MRKIRIFLFSLLSCFSANAQDAELLEHIDFSDLSRHIHILASDSLAGRLTGSQGQKKAAAYIAEQFKDSGLEPYGDSFKDTMNLYQLTWGEIYIKTEDEILKNGEDISYLGYANQSEEKEVEVVFAGLGTEEELDKIDIENRLVFVFSDNILKTFTLNQQLRDKGAYGLIIANPYNAKNFTSIKNTVGNYVLKKRLSFSKRTDSDEYHVFAVSDNTAKSITGQSVFRLKKYIKHNNIQNCPISAVFLKTQQLNSRLITENVIGFIPGSSDKYIVISAHYDHLGTFNNSYFPGADDNASGTAALMELAEAFSHHENLKYNIIFLATTGEEMGFLGAHHFIKNSAPDSKNIIVNLNLDMISRSNQDFKKYIYVLGTNLYPQFNNMLAEAESSFLTYTFDYTFNNGEHIPTIYQASDQYIFHENNIPALMFFTGLHDDYHTPHDTADKIDYTILTNRVKLIGYFIQLLQERY